MVTCSVSKASCEEKSWGSLIRTPLCVPDNLLLLADDCWQADGNCSEDWSWKNLGEHVSCTCITEIFSRKHWTIHVCKYIHILGCHIIHIYISNISLIHNSIGQHLHSKRGFGLLDFTILLNLPTLSCLHWGNTWISLWASGWRFRLAVLKVCTCLESALWRDLSWAWWWVVIWRWVHCTALCNLRWPPASCGCTAWKG